MNDELKTKNLWENRKGGAENVEKLQKLSLLTKDGEY